MVTEITPQRTFAIRLLFLSCCSALWMPLRKELSAAHLYLDFRKSLFMGPLLFTGINSGQIFGKARVIFGPLAFCEVGEIDAGRIPELFEHTHRAIRQIPDKIR